MRWFNFPNRFPYSDFHSLNLDWILEEITRLRAEWETLKAEWAQMKIDWQTFQAEMQRLWQEYKDLMDAAYAQLRQEWSDYKDDLDAWKAGVDQSIADFETAWENYKTDVDASLSSMQTQIDNFISSMETYILNNLPSIVSPIVRQWLDEHGINAGAVMTPEDFGAVGDGVTDDTAAWNAWLNGATIHELKPNRIYKIGTAIDPVRLPDGLNGNGSKITGHFTLTPGFEISNVVFDNLSLGGIYTAVDGLPTILRNISCNSFNLIDSSNVIVDGLFIRNQSSITGTALIGLARDTNVHLKHVMNFNEIPSGMHLFDCLNFTGSIQMDVPTAERFLKAYNNSTGTTEIDLIGPIRKLGSSWSGVIDIDAGNVDTLVNIYNYNSDTLAGQ